MTEAEILTQANKFPDWERIIEMRLKTLMQLIGQQALKEVKE